MQRTEIIKIVAEALKGEHLRVAKTEIKQGSRVLYRAIPLTAKQDIKLRIRCYHMLADYYKARMSRAEHGRFVKVMAEILFNDNERQEPGKDK